MSGIVSNLVNRLIGAGVDPGEAAEIIALAMLVGVSNAPKDTAAEKRRAWDRQRKRVKSGGNPPDSTGSHRNTVEAEKKVSPEPLSKKTLPSPPLGGLMVSRVTGGDVMALAEQIRLLQPPKHRRASVFQITRALSPVLRDHPPADVLAACRAYYAEPDQQEQGGKFAVNAARLLDEGRYRDWLPGHDPPAGPVSDAVKARRLQTFADTGEWKASWGPRPEERAA